MIQFSLRYILFLYLLLGVAIEGFSTVVPIELNERVEHAEQIVLAKLITSHSYWDAENTNIYTSHRLKVTAYLKNGNQQEYINIIVPGGVVEDEAQVVFPTIEMHIGTEYCVFLKRAPISKIEPQLATAKLADTYFQPYAYMQGVIPMHEGKYIEPITKESFLEDALVDRIFEQAQVEAIKPSGILFRSRSYELPKKVANAATLILKNGLGETTNKFVGGTIEEEKELIIQGGDFGNTIGSIYFNNSNNGGLSMIELDYETDITYWRNEEIRVKIPQFAGTGIVEVKNNSDVTIGSADIEIEWTLNSIYSSYRGFKQDTRQMPKLLNINGSGGYTIQFNTPSGFSKDELAVAAFERAVETWKCETKVNWILDKEGTTTGIAKDDLCVVAYSTDLPEGVLGLATTRYRALGSTKCLGEKTLWSVKEFDVVFRPSEHIVSGYEWNFGETGVQHNQFDFESIALHELGHALGLGHVINEDEVMHFSITNGQDRRHLHESDVIGGIYKTDLSVQENCITSRPVMIHSEACSGRNAPVSNPTAYIKLLLEGLFDTVSEEMRTIISLRRLLPKSQPYNVTPYDYTGIEVLGYDGGDIVDWILIQLRDVNNTDVIISQKAALLRKDGFVIDADGNEKIDFGLVRNDSFYIAIYHRSHLPIMSSTSHFFEQEPTTYDFSSSESSTRGKAQQKSINNKFLLNSGDFDGNGIINNQDFNQWKLSSSAINVYLAADADGNGIVNNQDYNLWKTNRSKVSVLVE